MCVKGRERGRERELAKTRGGEHNFPVWIHGFICSFQPSWAALDRERLLELLLGPEMDLDLDLDLCEDGLMLDWEAVLELDEVLAGWFLQAPAAGDWGWEWDLQEQQWDSEGIPAVSYATLR